MGENKPSKSDNRLAVRKAARAVPTQVIKNILTEKGLILDPPRSGRATVGSHYSRVFATMFGFDGSESVRLKTDTEGRAIISNGFTPRTRYERHNNTVIFLTGYMDFILDHICHRVQVFSQGAILECSFGLKVGDYQVQMIGTPFVWDASVPTNGSNCIYEGRTKVVRVGLGFASGDTEVSVIGYYET